MHKVGYRKYKKKYLDWWKNKVIQIKVDDMIFKLKRSSKFNDVQRQKNNYKYLAANKLNTNNVKNTNERHITWRLFQELLTFGVQISADGFCKENPMFCAKMKLYFHSIDADDSGCGTGNSVQTFGCDYQLFWLWNVKSV